jgi:hypothetical protein
VPTLDPMKFETKPGERLYAVAVREASGLWLVMWVKRSIDEFFVFVPRLDQESMDRREVHASYHRNGNLHLKSHGDRIFRPNKIEPLSGTFRGTVQVYSHAGFDPEGIGEICDPTRFSSVVEVAPGILGPREGGVTVDLVEPGCDPAPPPWRRIHRQSVIRDTPPWVIITIGSSA